MTQLRIAVSLPGEASLGTFQAGAMAALVVAVERMNVDSPGAVRLDAMTGASSGALTAVLAAHALLTGKDPVEPLRRAWVVEPTIDALLSHDRRAPLSLDRARQVANELLDGPRADVDSSRAQEAPIAVNFALTALRGFTYRITRMGRPVASHGDPTCEREGPRATSHLDWAEHKLSADTQWPPVVDSAIASASHPAAFPPTLLDRSGVMEKYRANGVDACPDCPVLWYADGGLLDREPLGRCLDLVGAEDSKGGTGKRVVLLLRPEPDTRYGADDPAWTEDDDPPSWTTTLARALRLIVTHNLYEDLRRVERVNSRITWRRKVTEQLERLLPDDEQTRQTLGRLIDDIRAEKALGTGATPERDSDSATMQDLLDQLLDEATGLAGKRPIDVEVISARGGAGVAGGSLLNFGGFLGERLRANDFLVGYQAMAEWIKCPDQPFTREAIEATEERATTIPGWIGGVAGRRTLSWRDRADVLRVAGRTAWIGLRGSESRRV